MWDLFKTPAGMIRSGMPERLAHGIFSGHIGVLVNVLLFAAKLIAALASGSVAIAADAVNNLSDAGSCIVTLIGFRIANAPPDADHPFGHGRVEYIAALLVSVIIVAVGLNFLKESGGRVLHPGQLSFGLLPIVILIGSIAAKILLGFFYRHEAKIIDSEALRASALDSFSDVLSTVVVLAGAIASQFTAFPVDGITGVLVAFLIIAAGIRIIYRTGSLLLGEAPDGELVKDLRKHLLACPGIRGVHDIIIHSYGPNIYFATAHAEVDRHSDILEMHDILEAAEAAIAREMPIRLLLHCDPFCADDEPTRIWRVRCEEALLRISPMLKMYEFRLTITQDGVPEIAFDVLTSRRVQLNQAELTARLEEQFRNCHPAPRLTVECIQAFVREDKPETAD